MSKADHALITSVKPTPTRRNAPAAWAAASVPSVSQTDALPALPTGSIPPSRDCLEFQLLASLDYEARNTRAPLIDDTPECEAADAHIDRTYQRLEKCCKHIWQRPVRSLSDLRDLAEIAYFWAYKDGDDRPAARAPMRCFSKKSSDQFELASAYLIRAVLSMGGANV
jgi:hypothetical protein